MLQILGRDNSSNVQKVLWGCLELDVEFERHDYGGPYNNTTDSKYLALNPNSRVPTILDAESGSELHNSEHPLVMWESNAILRYLSHKKITATGDDSLYPSEPHLRAPVEQWLDWQQTTVNSAITPVFWGLIRTPEPERNVAAIEQGCKDMHACLSILDDALSSREYIAGKSFTIADIPLGIIAYRWFEMPIDRKPFEFVERWYQQLTTRKSFQQVVMNGLT